jgi:hypothetical protein
MTTRGCPCRHLIRSHCDADETQEDRKKMAGQGAQGAGFMDLVYSFQNNDRKRLQLEHTLVRERLFDVCWRGFADAPSI